MRPFQRVPSWFANLPLCTCYRFETGVGFTDSLFSLRPELVPSLISTTTKASLLSPFALGERLCVQPLWSRFGCHLSSVDRVWSAPVGKFIERLIKWLDFQFKYQMTFETPRSNFHQVSRPIMPQTFLVRRAGSKFYIRPRLFCSKYDVHSVSIQKRKSMEHETELTFELSFLRKRLAKFD